MGYIVFKELLVWQKAMDLVEEIYNLTKLLPKDEDFVLKSQIRRAVLSVPSNIAEGSGKSNKDFARFLSISVGSLFELETQILIAERRGYISNELSSNLQNKAIKLQRMISTFREQLDPQGEGH